MPARFKAESAISCLLLWLLASGGLAGCGAFDGGQSGTDSLEAIGVKKPANQCRGNGNDAHAAGDTVVRKDGCEECVCQANGDWKCSTVATCNQPDDSQATDVRSTDAGDTEEGSSVVGGGDVSPGDMSQGEETTSATQEQQRDPECRESVSGPSMGGSTEMYVAKDEVADVCVINAAATQVCIKGTLRDAGEDYSNWGGGVGFVMATSTADGTSPFNAVALGVTRVRFTLSGVDGFILRTYLNQVDAPEILDAAHNYQNNSFVLLEASNDGTFDLPIGAAALPAWTRLDTNNDGAPDPETTLDPSQLNSVQFFLAARPQEEIGFEVCISDLQWLNESGETVIPTD